MEQGWSSEAASKLWPGARPERTGCSTAEEKGPRCGGALLWCARQSARAWTWKSSIYRQGEESAEQQGCRGRRRIRRWLQAKRWADEQEADRGSAAGSADHYLQSPIRANLLEGERRLSAGKESGAPSGAPRNEAGTDGGALSVDGQGESSPACASTAPKSSASPVPNSMR